MMRGDTPLAESFRKYDSGELLVDEKHSRQSHNREKRDCILFIGYISKLIEAYSRVTKQVYLILFVFDDVRKMEKSRISLGRTMR